MAKAWDVVAYTADGDIYCPRCAVVRYGTWIEKTDVPDHEGNNIMAVFASDPHEGETCGGCLAPIYISERVR